MSFAGPYGGATLDSSGYIRWCAGQKRGIRMVEPSECLRRAYAGKSRDSMRAMQNSIDQGLGDWAYSASYYAMHFSAYAVLMKAGIRCEIHDCTIALIGHLFGESIDAGLVEDFERAKKMRVEAQYYTAVTGPVEDAGRLTATTCRFVLAMEDLADGLNSNGIEDARARLLRVTGGPRRLRSCGISPVTARSSVLRA